MLFAVNVSDKDSAVVGTDAEVTVVPRHAS